MACSPTRPAGRSFYTAFFTWSSLASSHRASTCKYRPSLGYQLSRTQVVSRRYKSHASTSAAESLSTTEVSSKRNVSSTTEASSTRKVSSTTKASSPYHPIWRPQGVLGLVQQYIDLQHLGDARSVYRDLPLAYLEQKYRVTCVIDAQDPESRHHRIRIWIGGFANRVRACVRVLQAHIEKTYPPPYDPSSPEPLVTQVVVGPAAGLNRHVLPVIPVDCSLFEILITDDQPHRHLLADKALLEQVRRIADLQHIAQAPSRHNPDVPVIAITCQPLRFTLARLIIHELVTTGTSDKLLPTPVATPNTDPVAVSFRRAMRQVPSPVAVLTTIKLPSAPPTDAEEHVVEVDSSRRELDDYRGMTISSLTTVTLGPPPIISFNIRTPSRTWTALKTTGSFYLHMPADNAAGRSVSQAFAELHDDPHEPFRRVVAQGGASILPKSGHPPYFKGPGIRIRFECRLLPNKAVRVGDHIVLFAEILAVNVNESEQKMSQDSPIAAAGGQTSLLYAHGTYMTAAPLDENPSPETATAIEEKEKSSPGASADKVMMEREATRAESDMQKELAQFLQQAREHPV